MSDRNNITKIKTNSERTIQGLITKQGEFRYKQTNGLVRPDLIYSTYFTEDKRVHVKRSPAAVWWSIF